MKFISICKYKNLSFEIEKIRYLPHKRWVEELKNYDEAKCYQEDGQV